MVHIIPPNNQVDRAYTNLVAAILANGETRQDRTGVGTYGLFGGQTSFDVSKGFPLLTSKKVHVKSIIHELLWFLSGSTDVKYLQDNKVTIWDEWLLEDGTIGNGYGKQWRNFAGVDQIAQLIHDLKTNPFSRRHIVTAWNPPEIPSMALPPCHMFFQCYVTQDGRLDLHLYQRSVDVALGLPFNWASYALLMHMIGQQTDLIPRNFVHSFGDVHIYQNHKDGLIQQIKQQTYELPTLKLNKAQDIFSYKYTDITIENYQSSPSIKYEIAV